MPPIRAHIPVMPDPIFDTALAAARLARAMTGEAPTFLLQRCVADLVERLALIQRRFTTVVDLGTPTPRLARAVAAALPDSRVARFGARAIRPDAVCDLERLPLAAERVDLAVSALALQGVNDLPGVLVQARRALKPDGLFLGAMLGGGTLRELRAVLGQAETELCGGVSPRVAPFADVRDMGGLLQRAGFALPVADSETLTVRYDHLFALMADLRAMGATNALVARSRVATRRAMFAQAARLYAERYADPDGRIRATFEIVFLSGWAPHESQQKPAARGSGTVSLAAVLPDRSAPLG